MLILNCCVCSQLLGLFSIVVSVLSCCLCSRLLCLFSVVVPVLSCWVNLAVAVAVLGGMLCPFSTVLSIFSGQLRLLSAVMSFRNLMFIVCSLLLSLGSLPCALFCGLSCPLRLFSCLLCLLVCVCFFPSVSGLTCSRTIMYEVLGGAYPYSGFCPESVIWSVCSGHRQNLANINCTLPLKVPLFACLCHNLSVSLWKGLWNDDIPEDHVLDRDRSLKGTVQYVYDKILTWGLNYESGLR